mmetsp:Transcript_115712/g.248624  ORF Transcript_115712/g.248624 Transcript_115712/m.248624 type:complete len:130 (+) Transcript_115712:146-535(+)
MNYMGLNALKPFPRLPSLLVLELGHNGLSSGFAQVLVQCCPRLQVLLLHDNLISSSDEVHRLVSLANLTTLDLAQNPLKEQQLLELKTLFFNNIASLQTFNEFDRHDHLNSSEFTESTSNIYQILDQMY